MARGVTATTITVGVSYTANVQQANGAMGAAGITNGDEHAQVSVIVADINRHGGIAGRRLVVVFHAIDATTSPTTKANEAQAECTFWTQDQQVFAVIATSAAAEDAKPCITKAGVPYISSFWLFTDDDMVGRSLSFELEALNLDRYGEALAQSLQDGGWYGGWDTSTGAAGPSPVKTGILTVDEPSLNKVVDHILVPAMARAGHAPSSADIVRVSAGGEALAQAQAAVLKFRADNVTHVVITDQAATLTLAFANTAGSQQYYPRLGGGSGNGFEVLFQSHDVPATSIHGAVGAGWVPLIDLPFDSAHPPAQVTPAYRACIALMNAGGQTFTDANAAGTAAGHCDEFHVLRAALEHDTAVTVGSFVSRLGSLGTTVQPCQVMAFRFAPARHTPTDGYYTMVFDSKAQAMVYIGPIRQVGA